MKIQSKLDKSPYNPKKNELTADQISHLSARAYWNRYHISCIKTTINIASSPSRGISFVQPWYSSPCGTDGSANGYYWGGRYDKDILDTHKKEENLVLLLKSGIVSDKKTREKLLRIPNHEGWGKVIKPSNNYTEGKRQIAAFLPALSRNRKKITGMKYAVIEEDFQNLKKGDWVVINAALRCDSHWAINPQKGFPDYCHRSTENNHVRKRVPGHYEIYGLSHYSKYGLPYPNQMLTKVPEELKKWIERKRAVRERILVYTEPLSCCFEAFNPIVQMVNSQKEKPPKNILILGDGPNSSLLTLLATTIFPNSIITVIGRSKTKLGCIRSYNRAKIRTVTENMEKGQASTGKQLEKILGGKLFDAVIPTFHIRTLDDLKQYIGRNAWLVLWSADQVNDQTTSPFKGIFKNNKIHKSYGGWNQAEWTALYFMKELARFYPKRLENLARYPAVYFNLQKGAAAMDEWLQNKGKYNVVLDGRNTSAKIIIDHRRK